MKKQVFKLIAIICSACSVVVLVLFAIKKDRETGFLTTGRKWIEDTIVGALSGNSIIEEYDKIEDTTEDSATEETTESAVLRAINEAGEMEIEAVAIVEDDAEIESGYDTGSNAVDTASSENKTTTEVSSTVIQESASEETISESETKNYGIDIPTSYYDYIALSLDDRIAIANAMGDDYEPWLDNLREHKDDGYIIVTPGGSVGDLN